jgi:DNA-binding Lrp family transcriptional regulator
MLLDNVDLGILRILQADARLTTKHIADKMGLTTTPIFERIKKLEKEGYIKNYVAVLDNKKIDRALIAFCNVQLKEHSKHMLQEFEKKISKLPEVMECHHIAGVFDYLIKVAVKDMNDYQEFITNKLAVIENIGQVQSSFVMTEVKSNTAFPL